MSAKRYSLVLDVGTTGTKAFVFNDRCEAIVKTYRAYPVSSPKSGWVEQDPRLLLKACIQVLRDAVKKSHIPVSRITALGITNQRETTILWDANTLTPIYPAIVWEDRRTKHVCTSRRARHQHEIRTKTGLSLDPYFSASKIEWILTHVPGAQTLADVGRLRFGTVDSWLLTHLCEHAPHVTDETNAARTLLFNIRTKTWDPKLCTIFNIPERILPAVYPSRAEFGWLRSEVIGRSIPVRAVIGDQQSSLYAAITSSQTPRATTKVTYGTGTFVMQLLGTTCSLRAPFFTTLVPTDGGTAYALEGKVTVSGPEVTKRLSSPKKLEIYLHDLSRQVNRYVKRLPVKPKEIVIDGGITRDPNLAIFQEDASGIRIRPLATYDGTALGVALLLRDSS